MRGIMELIKQLRKLVDDTGNKSEFCRMSEISRTSLHRITNPDGNPRLSNLLKLVDNLGYKLELVKK